MNMKNPKIRGLDNKIIKLDIEEAERINVFDPQQYELSEDGTYVTDIATGETIPLTVFYLENDGARVVFSTDEDNNLIHVRIVSENGDQEEDTDITQVQNFQSLVVDGTTFLVGYPDVDIDLSNVPPYGEPAVAENPIPDDLPTPESEQHQGNRRAQANNSPGTAFGRTCSSWDYLGVAITTDSSFASRYPSHLSRVQAILAEAVEIYWRESCVFIYLSHYENTVTNSWYWESYPQYTDSSGCGDFGALDMLQWEARNFKQNVYRDVWHMFTGNNFADGNTAGCAYYNGCGSKDYGYGIERMTFTTSLRLQAIDYAHVSAENIPLRNTYTIYNVQHSSAYVTFSFVCTSHAFPPFSLSCIAQELGHNLNLPHLSNTNGNYVMEPYINYAPYDLTPSNANSVRNLVLGSSVCGWY